MHKQRSNVEKSTQELCEQIKLLLSQRLYTSLLEAKVDRQVIIKVMNMANLSVDEAHMKYSKHFFKAIEDLVASYEEAGVKKKSSKS